ncbi:MAG: GAF domain-containing protein [Chloroflexota bacterium]
MSQKQTTLRLNLTKRLNSLPIRVKLLVPIIVGLGLTLVIILSRVQSPIDTLAANVAQESFGRQLQILQDRTVFFLETSQGEIANLAVSDPVQSFTAVQEQGNSIQQTRSLGFLGAYLQDRVVTSKTFDVGLRYVGEDGKQLSYAITRSLGDTRQGALKSEDNLVSEADAPYFKALMALHQGQGYVLPINLSKADPVTGQLSEPIIEIGVPVYNNGKAVGALIGSLRGTTFLKGLLNTQQPGGFLLMLVEQDGKQLSVADFASQEQVYIYGDSQNNHVTVPPQFLNGAAASLLEINGRLYSTLSLKNIQGVPGNSWIVLVSQTVETAYASATSLKTTIVLTLGVLFLLISVAVVFAGRTLTYPLTVVSQAASRIAAGDLKSTIPDMSGDEIGQLAAAFNTMSGRLAQVVGTLESRVEERTRNIEIASEIGRDAAQLRDIDTLLQRSVDSIRDRFNFYHAQVFLLDDTRQYAVLITSTGEAGQILLARHHKLAVDSDSVIGQTTAKGRTFITLDTEKSDVPHRFNPILPKTRSEMALPLRVSDVVIGALDIQSVEPNAFSDSDIQIFQLLADQIAVAIDNARLLKESETRLQQVADLNRELTRTAWNMFVEEENPDNLGFKYDLLNISPNFEADSKDTEKGINADIKVRGETVGSLSVQEGEGTQFSEDDKAILQAVAERVALAIENVRLVEQTRNALGRIEQLYQASRTLGSANDTDGIFKITTEQLANFEFLDRVVIFLARPDPVPEAQYYEVAHVWERHPSEDVLFEVGQPMPSQAVLYGSAEEMQRAPRILNVAQNMTDSQRIRLNLSSVGVQSVMIAPITTTTRWFGVMLIHSYRPHAFHETFTQFVSAISDQVAIAVENQALLENVQSESRRNRALAEAAQVSSQIGIDFATGISNLFKAVSGPADYDRWWFGQYSSTQASPILTRVTSHFGEGSPLHLMARINLDIEQNTIAEATRLGEWVLANDPVDHHAMSGLSRDKALAFGKHIAAPVKISGQIVGTLLVGRDLSETDLDDRDIQLVLTLTNQIAVVLENQRLFTTAEAERQTVQAVLNSLPTGVVVVDANTGEMTLTNELARTLLGLDEETPYERIHVVSGEDYGEDEFPPTRVLRTLEPVVSEDMSLLKPSGERIELLVNAAPVIDHDGHLISAVAVFQDVTELRELETVLQDSLRETTSLYETSRAIAAETNLIQILNVVAIQVFSAVAPTYLFTIFRDEDGEVVQTYGLNTAEVPFEVALIEGDLPIPMSVLLESDSFTENDVLQNPELADDPKLQALHIASIGSFPLNVRSRVAGWLVIGFENIKIFTAEERRFIGTLSDQAAIAAESARLAQQTAQALNETTLLYEASYTINRATNIEDALAVVRDEIKFFAPTQIDIFLVVAQRDTSGIEWVLNWNVGNPITHNTVRLHDESTILDYRIVEADAYFVNDLSLATPAELDLIDSLPQDETFIAQASVPLTVAGRPTGRLVVSFNRPYRFGRLERQFITTLADQAAIVINNSMLVQQTQDSLEETGTLYQSSREISNAADLPQILSAIIDHATPSNVNYATLIKLVSESWDTSDALIEVIANWSPEKSLETGEGVRFRPDQYPAWDEVSSPDILWIEDVTTDPRINEASRNLYESLGVISVVNVPLAMSDQPVGALVFTSSTPWPRSEREIRIYTALADQASIYIENRNLLAQAERRARQLQTSAQIAQAATSILNLDELFDRTVNLIKDSFKYDHAQIFLINPDGTDAQLVASTGEPGKQLLAIKHHLLVGSQSVIGQVTSTGKSQIAGDTADVKAVWKPNPYLPLTRAEMALPLIARNHILGALDVQSNHPGAFDREDQAVLSNLANQIAVAIDNARLFDVSIKRVEEMRFLFDVTRSAAAITNESEEALHSVMVLVREQLGAINTILLTLDDTGTTFVSRQSLAEGVEMPLLDIHEMDNPLVKMLRLRKQPILVTDMNTLPKDVRDSLVGINSFIITPLMVGNELVGILGAGKREQNAFAIDAVTLLQTLSSTLAAIIQNARLLQQVQAANTRLREVDKLKSQFLANMSHELRTPLNSIIGFSRVILKGIDGPLSSMQEQDLSTIHESGKHLLNLVNDILDQAKIEAGKMELSYGSFSMAELIKSVMSTAMGLVKDKPVRLYPEVEPELPNVWGDEFRSRQILLNFVSNAAKFTAQGSVTVSAFSVQEAGQDMVQVSITDTGIGIPEDKLDAVFESFQQAENTTARQYEGTGLGLPIAKSLVEMQGGKVTVYSEVGVGSTFSFTLPLNPPEPTEEELQAEAVAAAGVNNQLAEQVVEVIEQAAPQQAQRIILAIDDELGMVNLYRRYLVRSGYEVIGGGAEEAEELASTYQPRLILLDINMPNRSGWDVLQHLKDRDETFEIPIIVCSIDEDKERAFRLGAADYLVKSIDERSLIEAVKRVELERDRRKILIIDDQPESMRLISEAIAADERFTILEATNGAQGLEVVSSHWPHLIILDIRMPDMDGFEVLRQLQENPDTSTIPVMVVTADDLTDQERAQLGGAWIYQKQDIDAQDLLNNVVSQLTW